MIALAKHLCSRVVRTDGYAQEAALPQTFSIIKGFVDLGNVSLLFSVVSRAAN